MNIGLPHLALDLVYCSKIRERIVSFNLAQSNERFILL